MEWLRMSALPRAGLMPKNSWTTQNRLRFVCFLLWYTIFCFILFCFEFICLTASFVLIYIVGGISREVKKREEREKQHEFGWVGNWEGFERNWGRGKYDKNKLHKNLNKNYIFKKCTDKWIELETIIFNEAI